MSETNDQRIYDRCIIRVGQLEADNAELRERVAELESERASLLWLLRTLAFCADDRADCDQCAMNGKPHAPVRQSFCDRMADRLREYGVEVSQ